MEMEEWTLTSSSFTSKPSFDIQNYKKDFSARNKHFKLDGPVILITIRNGHVLNLKGYFRSDVDTVPTYMLKLILATVLKNSKKSFWINIDTTNLGRKMYKIGMEILSISKGSEEMGSTLWVLVENKFFKVEQIVAISVVSSDYFRRLGLTDGYPQALLHQYQLLVGSQTNSEWILIRTQDFPPETIETMWEEDGLNFLDKMLSTSRLLSFRYRKNIAKGTTDPRVEFISQDHSS